MHSFNNIPHRLRQSLYSTTVLFSAEKLTVPQKMFIIICSLKVSVCYFLSKSYQLPYGFKFWQLLWGI